MLKKTGVILAALSMGVGMTLTGCTRRPPPPPGGDGCQKPATTVTDKAGTVAVGASTRRYTWSASNRTGPKPLVVDFHGLFEGTAGVHPTMSQFTPKAKARRLRGRLPDRGRQRSQLEPRTRQPVLAVHRPDDRPAQGRRLHRRQAHLRHRALLRRLHDLVHHVLPVRGVRRGGTGGRHHEPGGLPADPQDPVRDLPRHGRPDPALQRLRQHARRRGRRATAAAPRPRPPSWLPTRRPASRSTRTPGTARPRARPPSSTASKAAATPGRAARSASRSAPSSEPTPTSIKATDIMWDFFERFSLP